MNHELPGGWAEAVLDDLFSFVIGGDWGLSPETDEPNLVDAFCIRGTEFKFWDKDLGKTKVHRKITGASLEKRKLEVDDLVIEISGGGPDQPVGRVVLITQEVLSVKNEYPNVCTNFMRLARPFFEMHSAYIYYYLKFFYLSGEVENYQGGSNNLRNLKFKDYCRISVPIPPIEEQIRIADKLDRILARVNAAQTRLDKIPALIKRFRQTVLAEATSGELTREWRADDSRKDEFLTWNFSNIPEGWQLHFLPGISQSRLGKMLDKNKNQGIPVRYLGNINVRWGKFDLENLKEILVSEKEKNELTIKDGDLLVCEGGEPGRSAVWRGGDSNLTFQKALHRVRFDSRVVPEYGSYCFQNDVISNKMPTLYTGTTIKHLTGKALNRYPMAIPPIDEQHEIIRRVESLFSLADTVEKQYQDAKARTDRLTQAILAKAFRGELVPQDPADEPADVLLERIQAQRAEQAAAPKKRKSNTKAGSKKIAQSGPETEISRKTKTGKKSSKVINVTQSVTSSDDLLSLLKELGEESVGVDASILWKKSGLSIDDFYALLKQTEQIEDHIPSSDPAQRKLRVRK
ncbi:hypothetical protein A3746_12470 [Oleibacter sp. HI0075]|nr:hypothetical protein A3746_12470 [Oleibacter sp. HI0075]